MDKQIIIYAYDKILLSKKKEWILTQNNMDESQNILKLDMIPFT